MPCIGNVQSFRPQREPRTSSPLKVEAAEAGESFGEPSSRPGQLTLGRETQNCSSISKEKPPSHSVLSKPGKTRSPKCPARVSSVVGRWALGSAVEEQVVDSGGRRRGRKGCMRVRGSPESMLGPDWLQVREGGDAAVVGEGGSAEE